MATPKMPNFKCQVCDVNDALGTACSALGAISLSYCGPCGMNNAEPKELIRDLIDELGGLAAIREDLLNTVTYYEDGKYILMKDFK